mmetsp:Transcript_8735/g.23237  ORF Transcript_8735/g.23237 Transcript_8735/m.23237 type:complete len:82 (+) Transcript_8735:148-393(+)
MYSQRLTVFCSQRHGLEVPLEQPRKEEEARGRSRKKIAAACSADSPTLARGGCERKNERGPWRRGPPGAAHPRGPPAKRAR